MKELVKCACRFCGKKIIWGTREGEKIPLDPAPPVYQFVNDWFGTVEVKLMPKDQFFVSHWATCPKAAEVKKSKEKKDDSMDEGGKLP